MKRNILNISFFFLLSGSFIYSGCDKKNLDLLPHGPTEASYFQSEADFNKAIFGVYAKMTDFYWYNAGAGNIALFLLQGDDITTNASNEEFEIFSSLQPSSGRVGYMYSKFYQLINRANVFLEKVNNVPDGIFTTPSLKEHEKGEALFLRGLANYYLWNYYGTAPVVTTRAVTPEDFKPSGSSGTQLLDQAIQDFADAAALLPASWDDANRGRATANSANGFLGKCLVFRASASKNTADYTTAIAALDKINGAALTQNFAGNFSDETENNSESLFEFQAAKPFASDNVWLDNDFDNAIGSMSIFWGFYSNHWSLFGTSQFFATQKLANAFEDGDPRKEVTLKSSDRSINKYVTMDNSTGGNPGSRDNYRILRLSDVLLLKAEAILQSGGAVSDAIGLINQVRTRARNGGAAPADYPGGETDKAKVMNWIMNERFLELAGEGQRWLDLRRWHLQGIITLNSAFFGSNVNVNFEAPTHLLLPIPSIERDVNPNVEQNEGYN